MVPVFTATAAIIFAFVPLAFVLNGLTKAIYPGFTRLPLPLPCVYFPAGHYYAYPLSVLYFSEERASACITRSSSKRKLWIICKDAFTTGPSGFWFPVAKGNPLITGALSGLLLAMVLGTKTEQELFPMAERSQFNLEIWMKNGVDLEETSKAVRKIEDAIKGDKRIVTTASFVGTSSPRFHTMYAPETPRENYAQIFINTTSEEATNEMIREWLIKFENFLPNGYVHIRQLSLKTSAAAVEVRITGNELSNLKRVAGQIAEILEKTKGTNWIRSDYQDDYFGIKANILKGVAERLGVSNEMITTTLGAEIKGYPVSTLWEGEKPVDILLRLDNDNRSDFNKLENIYVTSRYNTRIPLKELVDLQPCWHTGAIVHRNGIRTLSILSESQLGVRAATIMKEIKPQIAALKLPDGVQVSYGGEDESTNETAPNMAKSLLISLILIFLTLLFQFKNLGKVLIVLATFPLSLLGAMLGLIITGNPFGFTAFMGIISLMGIVVRNGIILVAYADELMRRAWHYTAREAALAICQRKNAATDLPDIFLLPRLSESFLYDIR